MRLESEEILSNKAIFISELYQYFIRQNHIDYNRPLLEFSYGREFEDGTINNCSAERKSPVYSNFIEDPEHRTSVQIDPPEVEFQKRSHVDTTKQIISELAVELGRIFEYQISMIKNNNDLIKISRYAASKIIYSMSRNSSLSHDVNGFIHALLSEETAEELQKIVDTISDSPTVSTRTLLNWKIHEIFNNVGLRLISDKGHYIYKLDPRSESAVYGFRESILKYQEQKEKPKVSEWDTKFTYAISKDGFTKDMQYIPYDRLVATEYVENKYAYLLKRNPIINKSNFAETILEYFYHIGKEAYNKGEYEKSKIIYQNALEIIENIYGHTNLSASKVISHLAQCYVMCRNPLMAIFLYNESNAILAYIYGSNHLEIVEKLTIITNMYVDLGLIENAANTYKEAMRIYRETNQEDNSIYTQALHKMAKLYDKTHNYSAAIPIYEELFEIYTSINARNHMRDIALQLSCNYLFTDNKSKSLNFAYKVLSLLDGVDGDEIIDHANILSSIADIYYSHGEQPLSYVIYKESLSEYDKLDVNDPIVAKAKDNIRFCLDLLPRNSGNSHAQLYLESKKESTRKDNRPLPYTERVQMNRRVAGFIDF